MAEYTEQERQTILDNWDRLTPENQAKAERHGIKRPMAAAPAVPASPAAPAPATVPPGTVPAPEIPQQQALVPKQEWFPDTHRDAFPHAPLTPTQRNPLTGMTPSLDDPEAMASAKRSATKTYPIGGARPAQTREAQFGAMEQDVETWKERGQMVGEFVATTALVSLLPELAPIAASRYVAMPAAQRLAYWTARQILQPMVRAGIVGAGTAGVPLLFGKPMSNYVKDTLYRAVGALVGGTSAKATEGARNKIMGAIRERVKESPEGAVTSEVLDELTQRMKPSMPARWEGYKATPGMRTGSEGLHTFEKSIADVSMFGRRLRGEYQKSAKAVQDELKRVEARLSPDVRDVTDPHTLVRLYSKKSKDELAGMTAAQFNAEASSIRAQLARGELTANPDVLVQESIKAARSTLQDEAAERFGGIDLVIAKGRPDTGIPGRPGIWEGVTKAGAPPVEPIEPMLPRMPGLHIAPPSEKIRPGPLWDPQRGERRFLEEPPSRVIDRRPIWEGIEGGKGRVTGREPFVPPEPGAPPPSAPPRPPGPQGRVPTDRVSLYPLKAEAARLLHETQRTGIPTGEGEGLLKAMLNNPADTLSFREASQLLSNWAEVSRNTQGLLPGQAHGFAAKLSSTLFNEMERVADSHGAEVAESWRATRQWYKNAIQKFDNPIVERLMKAEPDQVFSMIAKESSPIAIKTAREAIDNPLLWGKVQQSWLDKTLSEATNQTTGVMDGAALLKRFREFGGKDGAAMRELFPGMHADNLDKLALALSQIQRGGGAAAPWNRLVQRLPYGGFLLTFAGQGEHMWRTHGIGRYGESEEPGVISRTWPMYVGPALVLTPLMWSKIMTSPRLTEALFEATKATTNARKRMEIAGSLMGLMMEAGISPGPNPEMQGPPAPGGPQPVMPPAAAAR